MSGSATEITQDMISISDPGEVGREAHRWPDRLMISIGNAVAWLFPLLMVAIVAQVFMRQAGFNQAWLDDGQWWIYGFAMLTGFGYAVTTQSHVRVDIFHSHFSARKQARIEVFAIGWLLLPFLFIMTDILLHYAWSSITAGEGSDSPNGLHRLYLLKTSLPILFIVTIIAAWGVFRRNLTQFSAPKLHKILLWSLPAALFLFTRLTHYAFYWFYVLTRSDLKPRRISKEPIFEYTSWVAVAIVAGLLVLGFMLSRKPASEE